MLLEVLATAVADVTDLGARAAVIGGLAVSVWTDPRYTRDADLMVVAGSDAEAEAIVFGMQQRGYRILTVLEHKLARRMATARLMPPGAVEGGIVVDLLFASTGIEREVIDGAIVVDVGASVPVPVARVGHLVALKLLSVGDHREHDKRDLAALREELDEAESAVARAGVRLIVERGFARGRDLEAALDALIAQGQSATP